MFRPYLLVVFSFAFISAIASAQSLCPSGVTSDKLICLIPQVYGINGLKVSLTPQAGAPVADTFQNVLPDNLSPLNSAIARESAVLPLASPSSGLTFSWSAAAKAMVPSTDSYGPILGERADTTGKYQVSLGFSYQYFKFGDLDGVSLKNLPSVFLQQDFTGGVASDPTRTCSVSFDNQGACGFIRDVVKTDNKVDLKVHQFTTFVTFGLTDRIDLSMAIDRECAHECVFKCHHRQQHG